MRAALSALVVLLGLALAGAAVAHQPGALRRLHGYVAATTPLVERERAILRRLEPVDAETAAAGLPKAFWTASARIGELRWSWQHVRPPRGLRAAHGKESRSLGLTSAALGILGDAYDAFAKTGDHSVVQEADARVQRMGKTIERLHRAWQRALRKALRHARP